MNRHARRHATITQEADAIGDLDDSQADLVVRGVAAGTLDPRAASANLPAQTYPAQTITTRPMYGVAYSPYPELPAHVADQIIPDLAQRTGPGPFQRLQDWHAWPAVGTLAGMACGWGAAATEPMHAWFGGVFTAFGLVFTTGYGAVHLIRAVNADSDEAPLSVGVHVMGIGGVAATAFGVACVTGLSFLSAGVTLIPLAAGYYAWFQSRHSRIEDQRRYIVDYHAAVTPQFVPVGGGASAALAPVIAGQVLSHEEQLVRRAFEGDGVNKGMGIALSDVHSFARIDPESWSITVVLAPAPGVSPESIVARRDVLTSALGANQVIALPTRRGHELRLTVRYGDVDPLAETIPFPGPAARSIKEPIPIAEAADGSLGTLELLGTHTLIGGATFGGKSVLLKTLVISLAALCDAVIWLIDLKPGRIELGIFDPVADRSARSIADAALMLEALIAVAKARGAYLEALREELGAPVEQWDPDVHGPVLVVVFDEFAELVRQGRKIRKGEYPPRIMEAIKHIPDNLETALQVYRALGIQIVLSTQSPDGSVTAGNGRGALDQIQNLVCVQTAKISQTNIILGPGAHGDGFCAHLDLYVRGMLYMRTPSVKIPIKYKGYFTPNDAIVSYIKDLAASRTEFDPRSAEAAASVLGDAAATPHTTPPSGGSRTAAGPRDAVPPKVPYLRAVPAYPDGTEIDEKHQALWELLGSFDMRGTTVSELHAAAKRAGHVASLAWVRDRVKEWREAGVVLFEDGREPRYWRDDDAVKRRFRREA